MKHTKQIIGLLALTGAAIAPATSFAYDKTSTDNKIGIYITPKLLIGSTYMDTYAEGRGWAKSKALIATGGGSLAMGYDFSKRTRVPIRTELEYATFTKAELTSFTHQESYTLSNQVSTLFVNAYYKFKPDSWSSTYIGVGLGTATIKAEGSVNGSRSGNYYHGNASSNVSNFAYNIAFGSEMKINNSIALDIGYRFADLGSVKRIGDSTFNFETKNLYQHQVSAGLRFTF